ncbi:hypothetical protein swp_3841 [Shewanella piezotolerans WP3]|uniref:Uncharacterized protein n=1 Tax=Shewanella piezotolerans (strain WP3 / JCM 13877) TaxID=225849 RepID=B8CQQ3_SHEPW|nr:hypothetical protein swp_3841 [Shewanella piezotolerans WP3]
MLMANKNERMTDETFNIKYGDCARQHYTRY